MNLKSKNLTIIIGIVLLASCSSNSSPTYSKSYKSSTSKTKSSIPKVPAKIIPGGNGDNWRYLGATSNTAIRVEINESSITPQSAKQYKYQDRKTIVNPSNFAYQNTPSYYYSLSWWLMDCNSQQYIVNSTALYDVYGKPIKNYNFTDQNYSPVTKGSIAEQQYNYICNNSNRNVGY